MIALTALIHLCAQPVKSIKHLVRLNSAFLSSPGFKCE